MTVQAAKLDNRDIYEITYDKDKCEGDLITAQFHNQADGDKSTYKGANDGKFVVTVDAGFDGTDDVTVSGSAGGEGDTGTVTFG